MAESSLTALEQTTRRSGPCATAQTSPSSRSPQARHLGCGLPVIVGLSTAARPATSTFGLPGRRFAQVPLDGPVCPAPHLAHSLDIEVVAVGVETVEQRAALKELGCDALQGYLFGAPLPAEDATTILRKMREAEKRKRSLRNLFGFAAGS